MRKLFGIILAVLIISIGFIPAQAAAQPVTVKVNGTAVKFPDAQPFVDENNRTLVPIRFVAETLGAAVNWEPVPQVVTIQTAGNSVGLKIGESKAYINGQIKEFDTRAQLIGGRTFVPLRFVSETLGATVQWDGATGTVLIATKEAAATETPAAGKDAEFEKFINSPEAKQYASTDYFYVKDGQIVFKDAGVWGKYGEFVPQNVPYKNIRAATYNIIRDLVANARKYNHYVRVFYNEASNCIVIDYYDSRLRGENATQDGYFRVAFDMKPRENGTFIFWDAGRLRDKPEEELIQERYSTALFGMFQNVYGSKTGKVMYDYAINEYLTENREGAQRVNEGIATISGLKVVNLNDEGFYIWFRTDYK